MINIAIVETDRNGDVIRCHNLLELKEGITAPLIDLLCDCKEDLELWLEQDAYHDYETFLLLERIDKFLNDK